MWNDKVKVKVKVKTEIEIKVGIWKLFRDCYRDEHAVLEKLICLNCVKTHFP